MSDFELPPVTDNRNNSIRRAGFEFELAGIELESIAEAISDAVGGRHDEIHPFHHLVKGTDYGDFSIVADANLLKNRTYETYLRTLGLDIDRLKIRNVVEDLLDRLASVFIPYEIITPPIPINELDVLEKLREILLRKKARGTGASVIYAFGLHINIETPSLETKTLLNYLRAFTLLYPWIMEESEIDPVRRLSPYIDGFPSGYVRMILSESYKPRNISGLIEDYMKYNPTRNRPLDMLPLFSCIDKELVTGYNIDRRLLLPRPAFHYRLPNCLIDDPRWRLSDEWCCWIEVEKLAFDEKLTEEMSREYLKLSGFPFAPFKSEWIEKTKAFMDRKR